MLVSFRVKSIRLVLATHPSWHTLHDSRINTKKVFVHVPRDSQGVVYVKGCQGNHRHVALHGTVQVPHRYLHLQVFHERVEERDVRTLHPGALDLQLPSLVGNHLQIRGRDHRALYRQGDPGQHPDLEVDLADQLVGGDHLADPSDPRSRRGLRVEGESVFRHVLVVLSDGDPYGLEKRTRAKELGARVAEVPFSLAERSRILGGVEGLELGHQIDHDVFFLLRAVGTTVRYAGQEKQFSLQGVAYNDVFFLFVDGNLLDFRWEIARVVIRR
mmetsp:Transcript_71819/g.145720  ORF Transcript_71819/g.145720 Transcript_71819/m.145720 type:complete len:272 (+) Transcript_71819:154-969(+)